MSSKPKDFTKGILRSVDSHRQQARDTAKLGLIVEDGESITPEALTAKLLQPVSVEPAAQPTAPAESAGSEPPAAPAPPPVLPSAGQVIDVPLASALDNPYNARRVYLPEPIETLAKSIRQEGQLTPAHAFAIADQPGCWQLVDGHSRKRALLEAGLPTIRILPIAPVADFDLYRLSFLLNHERTEQTAYDNAVAWRELLDKGLIQTQDELAERLGVTKGTVSKTLCLTEFPEAVSALIRHHADRIGAATGYALYQCGKSRSEQELIELFWKVIEDRLSTRELESLKDKNTSQGPIKRTHSRKYPIRHGRSLLGNLREWDSGRIALDLKGLSEEKRSAMVTRLLQVLQESSESSEAEPSAP